MENINIEEVKKYNEELKELKEKSARLSAQIEFNENELRNRCNELSNILGTSVTQDNLEAVYAEYVQKVNAALNTGKAILNKIKNEKQLNEQETAPQQQVNIGAEQLSSGMQQTINTAGQQMAINNQQYEQQQSLAEGVFNSQNSQAVQPQQANYEQQVNYSQTVQQTPVNAEDEAVGNQFAFASAVGQAKPNSMIASVGAANNGAIRI